MESKCYLHADVLPSYVKECKLICELGCIHHKIFFNKPTKILTQYGGVNNEDTFEYIEKLPTCPISPIYGVLPNTSPKYILVILKSIVYEFFHMRSQQLVFDFGTDARSIEEILCKLYIHVDVHGNMAYLFKHGLVQTTSKEKLKQSEALLLRLIKYFMFHGAVVSKTYKERMCAFPTNCKLKKMKPYFQKVDYMLLHKCFCGPNRKSVDIIKNLEVFFLLETNLYYRT